MAMLPRNVAFVNGHLYIADAPTHKLVFRLTGLVREMSPGSNVVTTLAGTRFEGVFAHGGPATSATQARPGKWPRCPRAHGCRQVTSRTFGMPLSRGVVYRSPQCAFARRNGAHRYAVGIRSGGMVEGVEGDQDDAPFALCAVANRRGSALCDSCGDRPVGVQKYCA